MTQGEMITFNAAGQATTGYLARPAQPGPGVVVLQEYWGLVDHIKSVCDRFAAEGFVALAPDLFHGDRATKPDDAKRNMMALHISQTAHELRAAAEYLFELPLVVPKKIGVVGFCMGGQLALLAATEHGDRIHAAVDFYGIHPNVTLDVANLQGPVLAHFGVEDPMVTEAAAAALVDQITHAGKSVEAHFYEAGHAFFNDTRPEAYAPEAAKLAWQRTIGFLHHHLRAA